MALDMDIYQEAKVMNEFAKRIPNELLEGQRAYLEKAQYYHELGSICELKNSVMTKRLKDISERGVNLQMTRYYLTCSAFANARGDGQRGRTYFAIARALAEELEDN